MTDLPRKMGVAAFNLVQSVVRNRAARTVYRLVPRSLRRRLLSVVQRHAVIAPRFDRLPEVSAPRDVAGARVPVGPAVGEGVNLFGHLHGEFGLAESARMYASALMASGIPVALNDLDHDVPHAFGDRSLGADTSQGAQYGANLVFVSPDYMFRAREAIGSAWQGRTNIGCWFWELETVPADWQQAIAEVDGIMVASSFTEQAFRRVTRKPVFRVPLPASPGRASSASRRDFGLPADAFVFLVAFDFNSSFHRKNPLAAVEAFRRAFPAGDGDDVRLVVKSSNGHRHMQQLARLVEAAKGDARILVRDQVLPIAHMRALQRCADAYVSLHRAEGFGLGLAECMAIGKPVIATAWSGNTDFMSERNSCLVDFRLVPVEEGEYPHAAGSRWAEPNVVQAADWMRRLVHEPGLAGSIGRAAATEIAGSLCQASSARAIVAGVRSIAANAGETPCLH